MQTLRTLSVSNKNESPVYLDLTKKFNAGRFRAIITSGQAVVLHRLAIMSKDGDWILREDEESLNHILNTLEDFGAEYRFGAPLSLDWLKNGWSSHFEFTYQNKRIRTDFFTRPPRISFDKICKFWDDFRDPPFVSEVDLAETKKTMRLKDYAVIGELARIMKSPQEKILYSRSARDLVVLKEEHTDLFYSLVNQRPALKHVDSELQNLEKAIFEEQLCFMKEDEARLVKYSLAAEVFKSKWLEISKKISAVKLSDSHDIILKEASKYLPKSI